MLCKWLLPQILTTARPKLKVRRTAVSVSDFITRCWMSFTEKKPNTIFIMADDMGHRVPFIARWPGKIDPPPLAMS